jgi:A/G-specific adenine glycosylase
MDVEALLDWYARVRRPLPWRFTDDPYAILVSEVMLQQTQAARVVPYYERFLARFPDPGALAAAAPAEVLAAWSGLGYNRRALQLQRAAAHVVAHGWPCDAAGLRALPGVGPYTAAAVASFAFGEQVACVDTNVRRVVERVGRPPALPDGRAADVNQAMMELGATVCTARAPRCEACPVAPGCDASRAGGPAVAPRARPGAGRAPRFEDTDRYLRGRVVAALLAGEAPPRDAGRVLDGLLRDGLVERDGDGSVRLPAGRIPHADFDLALEDPRGA